MKRKTSSNSAPSATDVPQTTESSSFDFNAIFGPIIRQLEAGDMTPREVSSGISLTAAHLAGMRFRMGRLAAKHARVVNVQKDNHKSMAAAERAFEATEDGQQEILLHHNIKALEGIQKALETNWFLVQGEAKQRY